MPKNNQAISGPNVTVEIAPATRSNPPDPLEFIKALVEQHFAELVQRRADFAFRPFLETARVSREIKRLQTVPEILAWSRVFQEHGCLHCRRRNLCHASCGLCQDCYGKIHAWKKRAVRENSDGEPEIEFKLAACDQEKIARLALTGIIEHHQELSAAPEAVIIEATPKPIEPERHSAWCVICAHPRREEIERDFVRGGGYGAVRAIVRKYGLKGTAGLYKHARALGLNAKRAEMQIDNER